MLDNVKRFDMSAKPRRQILRPLIWLLTFPESLAHKEKIKKVNMNGIKPPFLLLGNHNAFLDCFIKLMKCFLLPVSSFSRLFPCDDTAFEV